MKAHVLFVVVDFCLSRLTRFIIYSVFSISSGMQRTVLALVAVLLQLSAAVDTCDSSDVTCSVCTSPCIRWPHAKCLFCTVHEALLSSYRQSFLHFHPSGSCHAHLAVNNDTLCKPQIPPRLVSCDSFSFLVELEVVELEVNYMHINLLVRAKATVMNKSWLLSNPLCVLMIKARPLIDINTTSNWTTCFWYLVITHLAWR